MSLDVVSTIISLQSLLQSKWISSARDKKEIVIALENLSSLNIFQITFIRINSAYESFLVQSAGTFEIERSDFYSQEEQQRQFEFYARYLRRLMDELPANQLIPTIDKLPDKSSHIFPAAIINALHNAESLLARFKESQSTHSSLANEIVALNPIDLEKAGVRKIIIFNHETEELKYISNKLIAIFAEIQGWILHELLEKYRG
jgi:hypothetical protein